MSYPRPLTAREREMLLFLLPEGGFRGVDAYRRQVDYVTVTGGCACGCATIDLEVDRNACPEPGPPGRPLLPVEASGPDPSDPALPIGVILFARTGWLELLEIWGVGDQRPVEFPPIDQLTTNLAHQKPRKPGV